MTDTGFWAREGSAAERLAGAYLVNPEGPRAPAVPFDGSASLRPPAAWSGGAGWSARPLTICASRSCCGEEAWTRGSVCCRPGRWPT